jgi:crotonobetainyl-CoA:carnitine CoA-transferase CaiB-like acyl-CoA transferase
MEEKNIFDGLKVLDCASFIAAPAAATVLSDFGADVIKIEPPGAGDPYRNLPNLPGYPHSEHNFAWLLEARNKRSLALDLSKPEGQAVLHRLAAEADVFITNYPPQVRAKLGITYDHLAPTNERLIYASFTGYGEKGEEANKPGFDSNAYWARSGLMDLVRADEHTTPARSVAGMGDHPCAMAFYGAIVTALYQREKTGKGTRVDVTMFESLAEWMSHPLNYTHFGGKPPLRSGPDHATIVPYGRFKCGDGAYVMLGIQNEREWAKFCAGVLGVPGLATDDKYNNNTKRTARRAEVVALIEDVFARMKAEEVVARLDAADIANARINTPQEVWDHPQLKARNRWREVGSPAGPLPVLLPPVTMPEFEARLDPIPAIGEHTDCVLADIGYSAADIAELRKTAAV